MVTLHCKSVGCDSILIFDDSTRNGCRSPSKKELNNESWIEINGDVFCQKCALQALADRITILICL